MQKINKQNPFFNYITKRGKSNITTKPVLVFYIGVGNLDNTEIRDLIESIKKGVAMNLEGYHSIFIPAQNTNDSRVELLNGSDAELKMIKEQLEKQKN